MTEAQRFWSKVDKTGGCWLWMAGQFSDGYGSFAVGRTAVHAHRWSYESFSGPVPPGMQLDHTCHVRRCVNPFHLRPVTAKQNSENLAGARRDSKSGVRGVGWRPELGKWRARVTHNGVVYCLGCFDTIGEAAEVARLKRIELFTHNEIDRTTI